MIDDEDSLLVLFEDVEAKAKGGNEVLAVPVLNVTLAHMNSRSSTAEVSKMDHGMLTSMENRRVQSSYARSNESGSNRNLLPTHHESGDSHVAFHGATVSMASGRSFEGKTLAIPHALPKGKKTHFFVSHKKVGRPGNLNRICESNLSSESKTHLDFPLLLCCSFRTRRNIQNLATRPNTSRCRSR